MPVNNPREVFVHLLSDLRRSSERSAEFYQEISQIAQRPEIKEALEARAFVSNKTLATLDECFRLIGEQPVKLSGRLQEVFIEDFRRELSELQNPTVKQLFVLAKLNHLTHLRIGEYEALIAVADMTGNYGVGVLLESCLANKLALVERTKRLIRNFIETKVAEKIGSKAA